MPGPGRRFPKGTCPNPEGRGRERFRKELKARLEANGELTPLDVMLAIMRDPELDVMIRLRAATAAAPYVHRRKPQAFEVSGKFEFLSPEEREMRRELLLDEIRQRMASNAAVPGVN